MKLSHLLYGIAAASLALAIVLFATNSQAETDATAVGKPAPDFSGVDETGKTHKRSDYEGKLLVLEWTNPDCPFVARHYESDTMEKLAKELGATGVAWLAVNSTYYNKPEDTKKWRAEEGLSYPTLQDPDGTLGRTFGARTTPHMFVIGPKGLVRYAGAIDDDPRGRATTPANYVESAVSKIGAGSEPDPSETKPYGCSVKYARD